MTTIPTVAKITVLETSSEEILVTIIKNLPF
jgi:hypothetical protein